MERGRQSQLRLAPQLAGVGFLHILPLLVCGPARQIVHVGRLAG